MIDQTQSAIDAALRNDWQKALEINTSLLKQSPSDTDCMLRLGKAYLELGNTKKAAALFREVLKINKYDPIAEKNLLRATQSQAPKNKARSAGNSHVPVSHVSFLEEPGRTKIVTLVNLAPTKTLLTVRCADTVTLVSRRHQIMVENSAGQHLGALPDDLGHRLIVLLKGGNAYQAFVKSVSKGLLVLFIKESVRSKKFKNTPSFPAGNTDYLSFIRDDGHVEEEGSAPKEEDDTEGDEDGASFKKTERLHQDEVVEET